MTPKQEQEMKARELAKQLTPFEPQDDPYEANVDSIVDDLLVFHAQMQEQEVAHCPGCMVGREFEPVPQVCKGIQGAALESQGAGGGTCATCNGVRRIKKPDGLGSMTCPDCKGASPSTPSPRPKCPKCGGPAAEMHWCNDGYKVAYCRNHPCRYKGDPAEFFAPVVHVRETEEKS